MILLALLIAGASISHAEETVQPYIDSIRQQMKDEGKPSAPSESNSLSPYIDSVKAKMKQPEGAPTESYTEELRKSDPSLRPPQNTGDYVNEQKARIPQKREESAIEAVREGRSSLKMKRDTNIHYSAGLRIGAPITANLVASGAAATPYSFADIYGSSTLPNFGFFVEAQPFHLESIANVGLIALAGLSYASGLGRFPSGVPFVARTTFRFFEIPVGVGADLRINLAKYIKPYALVAPTAIGYIESRNDNRPSIKGYSTGFFASGGLWFLMDWVSGSSTWDLYEDGVKHIYLTAEVSRLQTVAGDVTFNNTAFTLGISFEF